MLEKSLLILLIISHYLIGNGNPNKMDLKNEFSQTTPNQNHTQDLADFIRKAPAPPKITPLYFRSNNDVVFQWLTILNTWTSKVLSYSYHQGKYRISENERTAIMTALSSYYSKDQAERLFSIYYKKTPDGYYEYLETESLSIIHLIEKNLQVRVHERVDSYVIDISGHIIDVVNEDNYVVIEVFEQYVFDKTDLRIRNITRSMK